MPNLCNLQQYEYLTIQVFLSVNFLTGVPRYSLVLLQGAFTTPIQNTIHCSDFNSGLLLVPILTASFQHHTLGVWKWEIVENSDMVNV
jgi:hypothetical protein